MNNPTSSRIQFTLTAESGEDVSAELTSFKDMLGIEQAASGRYSILLLLGLFGGFKSERLNPHVVLREIRALEGSAPTSRLKPPIQNKHQPLKGLWHKHYQEPGIQSLAMNVKKGLKIHGMPLFKKRIKEAEAAGEQRFVTAADIPALVNDVVSGNYSRLAADEALTGEWIIFAKHAGKNYYLALATHDKTTHEHLRQQIEAVCLHEFPFLSGILEPLSVSP